MTAAVGVRAPRRRDDRTTLALTSLALALLVLAGLAALRWHRAPHAFLVEARPGTNLATQVVDALERASDLKARGVIFDLAPTATTASRPTATASVGDFTLVFVGERTGTRQGVLVSHLAVLGNQLEIVELSSANDVDSAATALGLIGDDVEHLTTIPQDLRSWPRMLAWRLTPATIVVPLTLTVIAGLIALRRRAVSEVAIAGAMGLLLVTFWPSANLLAAVWVIVAIILYAVVGVLQARIEPALPPPAAPGPAPAPPSPPADVERRETVSVPSTTDNGAAVDLLVIGSPSRLADHVGLAPAEHTHQTSLESRSFRVLGVSAAGARHLYEGEPREDHHAAYVDDGADIVIAAVADGTSQASFAEQGAQIAAETAVELLRDGLPTGSSVASAVNDVIAAVNRRLVEHARTLGVAGDSLATTLVVAVGSRVDGERTVTCGRVGDSEALLLDGRGWRRLFGDGQESQLRDASTFTLPSEHAPVEFTQARWPDGATLVLASDGVADPLIGPQEPVRETLRSRWTTPPEPGEFVRHVQFSRRGLDDDRTVVAVWPRAGTMRKATVEAGWPQ